MSYDPDALDGLKMEKDIRGIGDAALAEEIFTQNSARAAAKICQIAFEGGNENLQFRAATYICDRVLGPAKSAGIKGPEAKDELRDFIEGITSNVPR